MDALDGDLDGDNDMTCVTVSGPDAFEPAYRLCGTGAGPQCAASGAFCFFCAFSESPAGSERGLVEDLKELVRQLNTERKEIEVIAEAVYHAYNDMVRDEVEWTAPNGKVYEKPEWTVATIQKHLLFSTEFEELFENGVDQIFHSLIYRLNDRAINAADKSVDKETHGMLMDTIRNFRAWKKDRRQAARKV
ncbi:MAG: hypothetical protein CL678_17585 [Bdellovibrionaceae bacterium]|nr:hypothetical protein [Pseudobdellovibrionaceae bacterium]